MTCCKRLYLHIGTEKTGTTTIQAAAGQNRERLRQLGVLYPNTGNRPLHLPVFASDTARVKPLRSVCGLSDPAAYAAFRSGFMEQLREEIATNSCPTVLLSSEHLSSRVREAGEIAQFAANLRSLAEQVKVIIYLRPQHELCLSAYSTMVKSGSEAHFSPPPNAREYYYNYQMMLTRWSHLFGTEHMIVRVFEPDAMLGGDVLQDFLAVIGIPADAGIVVPKLSNVRLDRDTQEFLRALNQHLPRILADGTVNPSHDNVVAALEAISHGPRLQLPDAVREAIAAMFAESNADVARRFLGRPDGRLFTDLRPTPESAEMQPPSDRTFEITAHLWRWKRKHLSPQNANAA